MGRSVGCQLLVSLSKTILAPWTGGFFQGPDGHGNTHYLKGVKKEMVRNQEVDPEYGWFKNLQKTNQSGGLQHVTTWYSSFWTHPTQIPYTKNHQDTLFLTDLTDLAHHFR